MNVQQRDSLRWLNGLEEGQMSTLDLWHLATELDPVLISLMTRYLRKKYPNSKPEAAGVMARLLDLSSTYPEFVKKSKEGEEDPISEWFTDTYSFNDFYSKPEEFLELIVDKLES